MTDKNFHIGTALTEKRIADVVSMHNARLLAERKKKREELLLAANGKKVGRLAYIFSGFRRAWLEKS